jgi:prepilin-type N-terminal cleavage/methylation domain-containing protein
MKRNGFTLIELMMVLVLLAITAAAAAPAFLGRHAMSPERRTATSLAVALVRTRDAARERGVSAALVLAPSNGRYWIVAGDSSETGILPLDEGVRITNVASDRVTCRFDAAGPATACTITVHGARDVSVRVDGWSGEIRVDDDRAS